MSLSSSLKGRSPGAVAAAKFFLRVGQVQAAQPWRDEWTIPLFPLHLILDAEGTLAQDVYHLVDGTRPR